MRGGLFNKSAHECYRPAQTILAESTPNYTSPITAKPNGTKPSPALQAVSARAEHSQVQIILAQPSPVEPFQTQPNLGIYSGSQASSVIWRPSLTLASPADTRSISSYSTHNRPKLLLGKHSRTRSCKGYQSPTYARQVEPYTVMSNLAECSPAESLQAQPRPSQQRSMTSLAKPGLLTVLGKVPCMSDEHTRHFLCKKKSREKKPAYFHRTCFEYFFTFNFFVLHEKKFHVCLSWSQHISAGTVSPPFTVNTGETIMPHVFSLIMFHHCLPSLPYIKCALNHCLFAIKSKF